MRRHGLIVVMALALAWSTAGSRAAAQEVDLLLVLAVDASGSVSQARFELQRQGYVDAFRSPRLHRAIASGPGQALR